MHYAIVLRRPKGHQLTLDELASHTNVHPEVILRFMEAGLIAPVEQDEKELRFDPSAISRLRTIVRLRRSLGINLAGISVVLDLLDKLMALQREHDVL